MDLTISIEDELLERARRYAAERGTSVEQLLRNALEKLVRVTSREVTADELVRLFRSQPGQGNGDVFRREDAYEDEVK